MKSNAAAVTPAPASPGATALLAPPAVPLTALGLLAFLWGYNWVVMKIGLRYIGPFDFAALRTTFAIPLLFGAMAVMRIPLTPVHLGKTVAIGLLQTTGFVGAISWALSIGDAGKSAVLAYTMPFWVIAFGRPVLHERLRGWQWAAVALALAGLVLVLELWSGTTGLASSVLALIAGAAWAGGVIVFKTMQLRDRGELLSVTAWQMAFGAVPLVLLAFVVPEAPIRWTPVFLSALVYNIVGGMAIATFLWQYILQRLPATISGLNSLIVPVVGVLSAWLQLGERPSGAEGAGIVLILAGITMLSVRGRGAQAAR